MDEGGEELRVGAKPWWVQDSEEKHPRKLKVNFIK